MRRTNGSSDQPAQVNLHIELPSDFHRRMKILCATKGVSLKEYATSALEDKVKKDEAKESR